MKNTLPARANEAILDELHQRWLENPSSVDAEWKAFFEGFSLGMARSEEEEAATTTASPLQQRVDDFVDAYRTLGHASAHLTPLLPKPTPDPGLLPAAFGFSEADLDQTVSCRRFRKGAPLKLRDLAEQLRLTYCDTVGAEFTHIQDPAIREWVADRVENRRSPDRNSPELHRDILSRLHEAESFEHFIHRKYIGQKRFSLEGCEALLLALNALLESCPDRGVTEIVMGMAHRGRLNILANFLKKPLDVVFNEFHDAFNPELVGGNGDVKYHLGYQTVRTLPDGRKVGVRMAANPSHLESVDPVVQGMARALQRLEKDTAERKKVLPILVHGDAAFIGQGIVAEVFNMSQLSGYRTGGTVHFIANNQIGFTTLPADARSTLYCTDIAKMVEAPIFHVNGEDPLSVVEIARIALEFRQTFGRDVVVDLYGYRRHGHNETDEPVFTQPNLYATIKSHPLLSTSFTTYTDSIGTITTAESEAIKDARVQTLDAALATIKQPAPAGQRKQKAFVGSTAVFQPPYSHDPVNTAISKKTLDLVAKALTSTPEGFHVVPKIQRTVLDRRLKMWKDGGPYDWGFAESLAFGSLLVEGTPVRLSGQDSRRGTFSHRNSVLYDEQTRERYFPLKNITPDQETFCVYNSPLSEFAVLGFDYGYSLDFPAMLCIWEAQFGDFSNGAQVIIDQFIASAEAKWRRPSSIVLLLPHGYEGQGPEHSSARLERFLQLCAQDNMQVCNLSTPAQLFHVLRRQIHRGYRKPLVIMSPKSLLRLEECVSMPSEFTNARFEEIIDDPDIKSPSKTTGVILCTGKVYYDLLRARAEARRKSTTAIVRIEQLYPLHEERLASILARYPASADLAWCQEEPENMGAWAFLAPRIAAAAGRAPRYVGRPPSASPATGSSRIHIEQQQALLASAFDHTP
jgi:2-oxoglutarate dehydrogenase E1 component